MRPHLGHIVTRLTAAIVLLGITGTACSADDAPPRAKASIMKASSDTQQGLAGNLKASIKTGSAPTIMKTKHDTTKNSISNVR